MPAARQSISVPRATVSNASGATVSNASGATVSNASGAMHCATYPWQVVERLLVGRERYDRIKVTPQLTATKGRGFDAVADQAWVFALSIGLQTATKLATSQHTSVVTQCYRIDATVLHRSVHTRNCSSCRTKQMLPMSQPG
jgi:hypothetical protein